MLTVDDSLGNMLKRAERFDAIEKELRELDGFCDDGYKRGIIAQIRAKLRLLHSELDGRSQIVDAP